MGVSPNKQSDSDDYLSAEELRQWLQQEFKDWHDDRQIDYILLGETPEAASALIVSETEDTKYE